MVGAGLAGLSCAQRLKQAGCEVRLFDKGRAAGGRMSVRRIATAEGDATFDHGAQYMTAHDPAFQREVQAWRDEGLAASWPAAGPEAWVGTPGMNAPVKRMAAGLDVAWRATVSALAREGGHWRLRGEDVDEAAYDAVLLAIPAEQAGPLLRPWDAGMAACAAATPAQPCWTVMAAFAERVPVTADVLRKQGPIGWAARNSAKPGRSGPETWVIQAGPSWSAEHLEDAADAVTAALLAAFADRAGGALPQTLAVAAHRWRYARSGQAGRSMMWNGALHLGMCGDWLLGPRVECAWLSGAALAQAVAGA